MKDLRSVMFVLMVLALGACVGEQGTYWDRAEDVLRDSVLLRAERNLLEEPVTVTSAACERSHGGVHDFYSEGDYWWPDSLDLSGPYVRRDGLSNPDNFTEHREALIRFSELVGNLTSAYLISGEEKYALAALEHCKAWFVRDSTMMNPNLLYAQAIQGRHTGRGIGIIDAIHFVEVVQSLRVLERYELVAPDELSEMKIWFADFLDWLMTHPYGLDEMVHPNNHGTCWNMQAGIYAVFTGNDSIKRFCIENYKENLLPNQMALDGSFPKERARTKPYGYSLFNLDAMVMNCVILSDSACKLWEFSTEDGRSILSGLEYMSKYVADKSLWDLPPDVMYWDEWPIAHPAYYFGARYFEDDGFYELWEKYDHFHEVKEVKRNAPVRNVLVWGSGSS